ncbi:MAG: hypothetical protein EBR82_27245 [Caulobacteraceae bacterium]|nr:hypothetical protein [Caulobacteraceae bacterium]
MGKGLVIVGSRCGGHDFFIELSQKNNLWIGARNDSDLDVLIKSGEDRPRIDGYDLDVWIDGIPGETGIYTAPYSIDGEVFIPKNLDYLQRVAKKRIRNKYGIKYLKTLWGREINFLNKNGSFFTRLKISRSFYL